MYFGCLGLSQFRRLGNGGSRRAGLDVNHGISQIIMPTFLFAKRYNWGRQPLWMTAQSKTFEWIHIVGKTAWAILAGEGRIFRSPASMGDGVEQDF